MQLYIHYYIEIYLDKMKPTKAGILATLISTTRAAPTKKKCYSIDPVSLTFYGFPDNDPPSADIAWDCGRGYKAGGNHLLPGHVYIYIYRTNLEIGNGTYTNPLTTATAPGEFNACETLYLPYLRKYLRVEDTCASCISDWAKEPKEHHIDVWMESGRGDDPGTVLGCEEGFTPKRGVSVVREPGEGYAVDGIYSPFSSSSWAVCEYALLRLLTGGC